MSTPSLADRFFVEAMSPAFREDPYLHYERFRGPDPLLRVADTIWFALGHADVTALLRHPGMSTDESHATTEIGQSGPGAVKSQSLLFMDPPDHTRLRNLVARAFTPRGIARSLDPTVLRSPAIDAAIEQARSELRAYLGELLEARRKNPGDDLLSGLALVEADGDRISSGEVLSLAVLLLVAGHETTVNLIGNGVLALLRAPEQFA